ncbi:MAG TPA: PaaI family thioesterase [Candidatus Dormibacteraeota bacterium]|nr:PaaI family thioesterase [Candidatus Dormibacteraeota bacterium]
MAGEEGTAVWREPARGGIPDPRVFQLSPDDFQRVFEAGKFPLPPLSHLTGTIFRDGDDERTLWEMPASPWCLSSQDVIPGGLLGVVADMALGSALSRRVRTLFSTSEMSFAFVRPATAASGVLTAEGRFVSLTGRLGLSDCTITDSDGEVIARTTARNVTAGAMPASDSPFDASDPAAVDALIESLPKVPDVPKDPPDPHLRPVVGEVLARDTWERLGGRHVLEGQIAGSLPMPPIHHLTGIRPTAVGDGEVDFAMPASLWLTSGFGIVQGGFVAFLGYSALASATQTTTEPGMAHVPVDLKVNFLRPVFADPELGELTAHGHVVHRGRTLSVADAEVRGIDGKMVAVARGTSMVLADSPATG